MFLDKAIKKVRLYENIKTKSNSLPDEVVKKIANELLQNGKITEPDSIKEEILKATSRAGATSKLVIDKNTESPVKLDLVFKFTDYPKIVEQSGIVLIQFNIDGIIFDVHFKVKSWNKFIENTGKYEYWIASLSGKLGKETNRGFILDFPTTQIFERKASPDKTEKKAIKPEPIKPKAIPVVQPQKKKKPTEPDCPQFKVKREYKPKFEIDRDFFQFSEYDYCRFVQIFGEDSFQFMKQTLRNPKAISVHWASQYMRVSDILGKEKVESAESSYELTTNSEEWPKARNWRRVLFRAIDIK